MSINIMTTLVMLLLQIYRGLLQSGVKPPPPLDLVDSTRATTYTQTSSLLRGSNVLSVLVDNTCLRKQQSTHCRGHHQSPSRPRLAVSAPRKFHEPDKLAMARLSLYVYCQALQATGTGTSSTTSSLPAGLSQLITTTIDIWPDRW